MTKDSDKTTPVKPTMEDELDKLERIDAAIAARRVGRRHSIDTAQRLQAEIAAGRRDAFVEVLADHMVTMPSLGALKTMAETDPLKHAQSTKIYANLAGIAEKHEIVGADKMSDVELIDALTKAGWQPPPDAFPHMIEGETEAPPPKAAQTSEIAGGGSSEPTEAGSDPSEHG